MIVGMGRGRGRAVYRSAFESQRGVSTSPAVEMAGSAAAQLFSGQADKNYIFQALRGPLTSTATATAA